MTLEQAFMILEKLENGLFSNDYWITCDPIDTDIDEEEEFNGDVITALGVVIKEIESNQVKSK